MTAYKNLDYRLDRFVKDDCQYTVGPYDKKLMQYGASACFSFIDLNKEFNANTSFELDFLDGAWITPLPEIRADLYRFSIGEREDAYSLGTAFKMCQRELFQFLRNALLTDLNDRLIEMERDSQ